MAKPNYKNLVRLYEQKGTDGANAVIRESFNAKDISPTDFELGRLFEECFGWHEFAACRRDRSYLATKVMEAAGAVSTAAFQNISGQIMFSAVMKAYENEEFVFTKLIPEIKTAYSGEKIPGISNIGDEATVVNEGDPYPLAGVAEHWIHTPETKKRGLMVFVSREAVFFDRTGVLLDRCKDVGYWLGVNREKRAIDCIIDENVTDHRYKYNDNTIATYGDSSGNHNWDNLAGTNALVDWTDIEAAELLLAAITDPKTGEPIMVKPTSIIVTPDLLHTARRIVSATELRSGDITTGAGNQTISSNVIDNYEIISSRLLKARMATDTTWYLGAVREVARYMVNWPMEVTQAPSNSHDEFTRDIIAQYKASERGAYSVWEPRVICKNTVA